MSAEPQQERRRERRGEARRVILRAAEALLLEEGYEAFSIRRLVDRCGYTAPTIYHHFGDKDGLFDAILVETFARLSGQLGRAARGEDPIEDLTRMAKAFVRFGIRHPDHYRLLFLARAPEREPPARLDGVRARLDDIWQRLWEEGRLRSGDAESAAQSLWALCHGLISGRIQRPDRPWSKTLTDDAIEALLRGLVEPAPTMPPRRRPKPKKKRMDDAN